MNFKKFFLGSVLLLALLANPAFAQNAKAGSKTSQAILTIQVNVVPMIALSQPQAMIHNNAKIAYNIPVESTHNTVTEETQEGFITNESGKSERRMVTLITIVAE
ncbi:MAG: hypothetical protein WA738_19160 [Candidatus Angelobacter sp.]